ncbi:MAG TPA: ribonuclease H [Polyangiales bacterium]|nr:ribonuclease H [Polyangiales bacterium]
MPWIPMMLRGVRVLARANAAGELIAGSDGRVEVRYKESDTRAYRAGKRNLEPIAGEAMLPDDVVAAARAPGGSNKEEAAKRARERTHAPDTVIVYADGACSGNPGPAGVGVVVQDGSARRELSQYLGQGTNNIAELTAILEAVEALRDVARPIRIHTDSQYAIGVLSKGWKAKANQALVAKVKLALSVLKDVELIYVPGHAGVLLNERADALAVQAVKSESSPGWISY